MLIAVEDPLGEAVVRKLVSVVRPKSLITQSLALRGKDYLREKAESLNRASKGFPVFLLTDLDDPRDCPANLVQSWLKSNKNPNLLFRVAVMEAESWLLADRKAFARFLLVPLERLPSDTDSIPHPKEFLISLARLSRSSRIREDLIPPAGATSKVGPAYNLRLREFVANLWSPATAAECSESLRRTLKRLTELDVG